MTDNYSFRKASMPQSLSQFTPYVKKDFNYIGDLNNSVYQNSSLTLIQYDCSSIYNASKMTNCADMFLLLPVNYCAQLQTAGGASIAPTANLVSLLSLKTSSLNLIYQCDLTINGQVVESVQPQAGIVRSWELASQLSNDDVMGGDGQVLGFSSALDNPASVFYSAVGVDGASTPGISNNYVFGGGTNALSAYATDVQLNQGILNAGVVNRAIQEKIQKFAVANAALSENNVYGAAQLVNLQQLNNEFRPTISYIAGNYIVYNDYVVIKLKDLFPSLQALMLRKLDAVIRLYVNTGLFSVGVTNPNLATQRITFSQVNSTFQTVCPLMISNITLPATTASVTCGLFIGNAPNYTITTAGGGGVVNFAGITSNLQNTRLYFSQIDLETMKGIEYIESNRAKKIIYPSYYYNFYSNIAGNNSSFSQLVNSGITNPLGLLIIPYIASSTLGFSQYLSPFDPAGGVGSSPCSLINIQVQLGGNQVYTSPYNYAFESYIEQISLFNKSTANEYGVESGLVSNRWWQMNRHYYFDLSRSSPDDKNTPRNLQINFNNNSLVPIDIIVITYYANEFTIDVSTGLVKK